MCAHQGLKPRGLHGNSVNGWLPGPGEWMTGEGEWGMTANGYGVSLRDDENVLKLIVVIAVQFCEYTDNH